MQTAAIVQACLGDEDGARRNLHALVEELFPENVKKDEGTDIRLNKAMEAWKNRVLPIIPSFHPPEGMELLPKIDLGPDIVSQSTKRAWGTPDEDGE